MGSAERAQWLLPANEAGKVLGWEGTTGKHLENKTVLQNASLAATRTVLKALDTASTSVALLTEAGRSGVFIWRVGDYSTEVTADTLEGIYVKADDTAASSGAWVRDHGNIADVRWFGAAGDANFATGGGTDDTDALAGAAAIAVQKGFRYFIESGLSCRTETQLDLSGIRDIDIRGAIFTGGLAGSGEPHVIIGGFASGGMGVNWRIDCISDGPNFLAAANEPLLRIAGLKNVHVSIGTCRWVQLYADAATSSISGIAYCTFNIGHAHTFTLDEAATASSFINENRINGGRFHTLRIGSDASHYAHNNNVFEQPCLEGDASITINNGAGNYLRDARLEAFTGSIVFASGAMGNQIERSYIATSSPRDLATDPIPASAITDSGLGNVVTWAPRRNYVRHDLFALNAQSGILVNGSLGTTGSYATAPLRGVMDRNRPFKPINSDMRGVLPGFDLLKCVVSFGEIYVSDLIPVELGSIFGFKWDTSVSAIRAGVYVYDDAGQPLGAEGGSGAYVTTSSWSYDGTNRYYPGANLAAAGSEAIAIRRSEVAFVRLFMTTNAACNLRSASIFYLEPQSGKPATVAACRTLDRQMSLASIPTAGFATVGTIVNKDDGKGQYRCTYAFCNTLDGALTTSATSVTVTAATGVANGDYVGILLDDGTTHWSAVSSLSSNTFTVSALPSAAASGNPVFFARWIDGPVTGLTPVTLTQQALTDNSGGSADTTIAAITNSANAGSADVGPVANAIADLAAQVNKARVDVAELKAQLATAKLTT